MLERRMNLMEEKQVILKRQQEEVGKLMQTQVGCLRGQADKQKTVRAEGMVRKTGLGAGVAGGWP